MADQGGDNSGENSIVDPFAVPGALTSPGAGVPRLETVRVTVRFGDNVAVDDVSLSVAPAESVAIVGPSGCGKSTLLRVIAGLQDLDDGRVIVDGVDITSVPTHIRGVGLMFQDHALFEQRSVAANIEFGLAMRKTPPSVSARRVEELLDLVDLRGFGPRAINTLSGGEAQRVALARSLAPTPSILLLDEPLGALDQQRRDSLVTDLRRVLRSVDQTVLYVTHDLAEAAVIGDRIAIMERGTIARIDAPERLWSDPGTEFVARFIGLNVVQLAGELIALAPDEIMVVDDDDARDSNGTRSDDSHVTITGSWFQRGTWAVSARTVGGRELRWISATRPDVDSTVVIAPTRQATPRAVTAST